MGILHINSMTICDEKGEDIACGLFGVGSYFNHSCVPNVQLENGMESNSGFASFSTIKDVEEGEELCLMYGGLNDKVEDRRKYFLWNYGFVCQCPKCVEESAKEC